MTSETFRRGALGALILIPLAALTGCQPKEIPPAVGQIIRSTVDTKTVPVALRDQKERVLAWEEMRSFYQKRQFQPAWFTPKGPRPQAEELVRSIDPLANEGLDPRRYQKDKLAALLQEIKEDRSLDDPQAQQRLARADMSLTYTFLTLAAHVASGRLQPETLKIDWYTKPRRVDLDARLADSLTEKGTIHQTLDSYAPPGKDYSRLREALARYRGIAAQGGWPAVGAELKPKSQGEPVRRLRARLAAEGYLPATAPGTAVSDLYDPALAAAVQRFQHLHGLETNGKVDAPTLAELDIPAAARVQQIEVNLERWRWLPNDFGTRYIKVNIPEFKMQLVEGGKPALEMRVVVGKAQQNRTPVFSDKMEYLELNPYWNIPTDIVKEEIEPGIAKDPSYLERKNMEVVTEGGQTRYRQRPGADNALGQVKFMFPNQFNVYLHDTPADSLFARAARSFSHGCVRVEQPERLAEYVLHDQREWTPEQIEAAMHGGQEKSVKLREPLPVYLGYFTARIDQSGEVAFRDDIYGIDAKVIAALQARETQREQLASSR